MKDTRSMKMICPICLSARTMEETTVLRCGHGFHTPCVLTWLRHRSTCPLCRQPAAVAPAVAFFRPVTVDAFCLIVVLVSVLNLYIALLLYIGWVLERRMVSVRYILNDEEQWVFLEKIR